MGQEAPRRFWQGSDLMDYSCTTTALSTAWTLACCAPVARQRMIGRPLERAAGPGETWTRIVAVETMGRGQKLSRFGDRRPRDVGARSRKGARAAARSGAGTRHWWRSLLQRWHRSGFGVAVAGDLRLLAVEGGDEAGVACVKGAEQVSLQCASLRRGEGEVVRRVHAVRR